MTVQRRTQQERREETHRRLVDATIACLIDLGYNRLTTTEVCRASGMSQGAIFKHFPTKFDLIAAAIVRLYEQLVDDYRTAVADIPQGPEKITRCLDALWALYDTPRLLAVFDLHTAARTDHELRAVMNSVEKPHWGNIQRLASDIFPEMSDNPLFAGAIDLLISTVQGAAISSLARRDEAKEMRLRISLELVARHFLEVANAN
ncbi:MAG: TetR/AcrR family transcriptional regulator [Myxococcota bacterium]|nr:TetR/AcrR family transcriptional regulator [Myxococcota bacterium]